MRYGRFNSLVYGRCSACCIESSRFAGETIRTPLARACIHKTRCLRPVRPPTTRSRGASGQSSRRPFARPAWHSLWTLTCCWCVSGSEPDAPRSARLCQRRIKRLRPYKACSTPALCMQLRNPFAAHIMGTYARHACTHEAHQLLYQFEGPGTNPMNSGRMSARTSHPRRLAASPTTRVSLASWQSCSRARARRWRLCARRSQHASTRPARRRA
jgi:hypothetical protein